jgi:ABC-2 type transport system permease protein
VIALLRTEFRKATQRHRTWIIGVLLVGLPVLISVAINAREDHPRREGGDGLFRLATQSGLLVPAAVLSVTSGFLLIVIAGTIAGDSVASDASWGNLRYLLMRPVSRGRLLVAKATVAGALIWAATLLIALASLGIGVLLFGVHDVVTAGSSGGGAAIQVIHLSTGDLAVRLAIATAYVAFGFTALLALGTLFSTLTDTAASAIGATVGVYIVSEILDAISQLGQVRYAFPTHYFGAWESMFTDGTFSSEMWVGVAVQVAYLVVFGSIALVWFQRKDIRS